MFLQKILSSSITGHPSMHKFLYETIFTDFTKDGLVVTNVQTWYRHRKASEGAFHYKSFKTYLEYMSNEGLEISKNALSNISSDGFVSNLVMTETIETHAVKIIFREKILIRLTIRI